MKKNTYVKQSAFTMLELVFAIIVIGVLAALAIPRLDNSNKQGAMDNILSDIRYTQHLALLGSKQMFNEKKWQQRYWHIVFSSCGEDNLFYMIGTDNDMEDSDSANFEKSEAATDPANGRPMFYSCAGTNKTEVSNRIFLTDNYGITEVLAEGGCNQGGGDHIGFDYLGRPQNGFSTSTQPDSASYMYEKCTLTFTFTDGTKQKIEIAPETGYAHIVGQENS